MSDFKMSPLEAADHNSETDYTSQSTLSENWNLGSPAPSYSSTGTLPYGAQPSQEDVVGAPSRAPTI
ncbi:hypothetical protein PPTG_23749 [Phytophthora nicotianae INRA-310]|uniref:Uncharacterized protein n=1 Tax=Phytophthora nicotianae (strain INRA-310) TaxID=761204 RepID=W2PUX2_PHYN3|nr:hypothetical protein PPTG_23749 [Phytophthora nicotianae INRA-310]ETN03815.1 hypothetical protein PPTG_23749 [Phytophthora nicotianae INRA-310]